MRYHEQWHDEALASEVDAYNAVLRTSHEEDDVDDEIQFCGNVASFIDDDIDPIEFVDEDAESATPDSSVTRGDDREFD